MKLRTPALFVAATGLFALLAIGVRVDNSPRSPAAVTPIETVMVAPGSFAFRLAGEYLRSDWPVDAPVRRVVFRQAFEIAKYQVSAADYARCVADDSCEAPDGAPSTSESLPVTGVSYRDAVAYAAWLSGQTGENWRLPTDEEWSFAAGERFADDALALADNRANPAARWLARYRAEAGRGERDPAPKVRGHFGANGKGISDMAGNVWEWTATCYARSKLAADDGIDESTENCGVRVLGGRHRAYMSTFIRDGKSGGCAAGIAPDNLGMRLMRDRDSFFSRVRVMLVTKAGFSKAEPFASALR